MMGGGISTPATIIAGDTAIYVRSELKAVTTSSWGDVGTGWGFTVVRPGTYRIKYAGFNVQNNSGSGLRLTKNGSVVAGSTIATTVTSPVATIIDVPCAAGDVIKLQGLYIQVRTYGFAVCVSAADMQAELNGLITPN